MLKKQKRKSKGNEGEFFQLPDKSIIDSMRNIRTSSHVIQEQDVEKLYKNLFKKLNQKTEI